MKERILQFIDSLRRAGLHPSPAESLDAIAAVTYIGIERFKLREALAATLVKEEADRPAFDKVFDQFFSFHENRRNLTRRSAAAGESGTGSGDESDRGRGRREQEPKPTADPVKPRATERRQAACRERAPDRAAAHLASQQALMRRQFRTMDVLDQEECAVLAEELARRFRAHFARRQQRHQHGRLDIRTTLRRSLSKGGVPIDPAFRRRRPGRVDLVVLCDCSHSVATSSRFLLSLLDPCRSLFRRVHLFGFVDRPVEVSLEHGHLVPDEPLDLYARSDFGNTLVEFWQRWRTLLTRNTLVLILGDARNNRRPPRADLLAKIGTLVRQIAWLNPEPPSQWATADGAMERYAPHCGFVIAAATPQTLIKALSRVLPR